MISDIINSLYELEGLMREIEYRAEETPDNLYEVARNKAREIAARIDAMQPACTPSADIAINETVNETVTEVVTETETAPAEPEPVIEIIEAGGGECPEPPAHESIFDAPDEGAQVPVAANEPSPAHAATTRKGNLRAMFTINDLFRFRRELFGNSDADMTEVLNMVTAMGGYGEAEEYFYGYLCWPQDNEQVADFMAVIHQYFEHGR